MATNHRTVPHVTHESSKPLITGRTRTEIPIWIHTNIYNNAGKLLFSLSVVFFWHFEVKY